MFYTYVGDLQQVAAVVDLDVDTVDVIFHYWLLKRKVSSRVLYCRMIRNVKYQNCIVVLCE